MGQYIKFGSILILIFGIAIEQVYAQTTPLSSTSNTGGPTGGGGVGLSLTSPTLQVSLVDGNGEASAAKNFQLQTDPSWASDSFGGVNNIFGGVDIAVPISNNSSNSSTSSGNAATGSALNTLAASDQIPNGFKISFPFSIIHQLPPTLKYISTSEIEYKLLVLTCEKDKGQKLQAYLKSQSATALRVLPLPSTSSDCATQSYSKQVLEAAYPASAGSEQFGVWGYWTFGISPSTQYVTSSYYLKKNLAAENTKHVLPSVTVSFQYAASYPDLVDLLPLDQVQWYVASPEFTYGVTEKDQTSKVACIAQNLLINCINGSIGSPKTGKTEAASFQIKIDFGNFNGLNFAGTTASDIIMIPKYTYDAAVGGTAFDLPFYLVLKSSTTVYPGIDVSWNNKKHNFIVGAFLATSIGS